MKIKQVAINLKCHPKIVLNNLENINAELIKLNINQSERLIKLNETAKRQIELFKNNNSIKKIEKY